MIMAEYIDREKVKSQLEKTIGVLHEINGIKAVSLGAMIDFIDSQPTEDVVPKSEVEHWKAEASKYQGWWCKTYNEFEIAELINEAKQEVAEQIFEEIERCRTIGNYGVIGYLIDDIAELRKKHIGE